MIPRWPLVSAAPVDVGATRRPSGAASDP